MRSPIRISVAALRGRIVVAAVVLAAAIAGAALAVAAPTVARDVLRALGFAVLVLALPLAASCAAYLAGRLFTRRVSEIPDFCAFVAGWLTLLGLWVWEPSFERRPPPVPAVSSDLPVAARDRLAHTPADTLEIREEPYRSIIDAEWARAQAVLGAALAWHGTPPVVRWNPALCSRGCWGLTWQSPSHRPLMGAPPARLGSGIIYSVIEIDQHAARSLADFRRVVRHEVAHAATPGAGHGPSFQEVLRRLEQALNSGPFSEESKVELRAAETRLIGAADDETVVERLEKIRDSL